jgi:hypothetical protein
VIGIKLGTREKPVNLDQDLLEINLSKILKKIGR